MAIKRTKAGVAVGVVTIAAATGWIAAAEAKFPPDSLQLAELAEIQAHLLNENFTLVDSLCIELTARRPSDPLGYLFRAATLWAEMVDQEEILRPVWSTLRNALLVLWITIGASSVLVILSDASTTVKVGVVSTLVVVVVLVTRYLMRLPTRDGDVAG